MTGTIGFVGYLLLGGIYAVWREWSYHWVRNSEEHTSRDTIGRLSALFNFPLLARGFFYEESVYPALLWPTGGGFQYWLLIAIIWPPILAWAICYMIIRVIVTTFSFSYHKSVWWHEKFRYELQGLCGPAFFWGELIHRSERVVNGHSDTITVIWTPSLLRVI